MMSNIDKRFIHLDRSIEEYITDQETKNTRAKTQRDVTLLKQFLTKRRNEILKKIFKKKNLTIIFVKLFLVLTDI
jgi:FixJ family two-component response regulator